MIAAAVTFDRRNSRNRALYTRVSDDRETTPSTATVVEVVEIHRGELAGLVTVKAYAMGDTRPRTLTVLAEDVILDAAGPFVAKGAARRWYDRKRGL